MFSKKYYSIIFVFFISLGMSVFMSGVITIVNTGLEGDFLHRWGGLLGYLLFHLLS